MRHATNALKATAMALPLSFAAVAAQAANVVETIQQSGQLGTFYQALEQAGMTDTLRNADQVTVFAPNDEAFDALPDETVNALLAEGNQDALRTLLGYHIVQGRTITSAQLPEEVQTESGQLFVGIVEGAPVVARSEAFGETRPFRRAEQDVGVVQRTEPEAGLVQDPQTTAADELQEEEPLAQERAAERVTTTGTVGQDDTANILGQESAGEAETLTEMLGDEEQELAPQQPTAAPGLVQDPQTTAADELQEEAPLAQERAAERVTATGTVGQGTAGDPELLTRTTEMFGEEPQEGARFVQADVQADNGVVHVLNYVLVPNAVIEEMLR